MAISENELKYASEALGLGSNGLGAGIQASTGKEFVYLNHWFKSSIQAEGAARYLRELGLSPKFSQDKDGNHDVIISAKDFERLKNKDASKIRETVKDYLATTIADDQKKWDRPKLAANYKADFEQKLGETGVQNALSFESEKDAKELVARLNTFDTAHNDGPLSSVTQNGDRWVVNIPAEAAYAYRNERPVGAMVRIISDFRNEVENRASNKNHLVEQLGQRLNVKIKRDQEVYSIDEELTPDEARELATKLNSSINGIASEKDGKVIINEHALLPTTFSSITIAGNANLDSMKERLAGTEARIRAAELAAATAALANAKPISAEVPATEQPSTPAAEAPKSPTPSAPAAASASEQPKVGAPAPSQETGQNTAPAENKPAPANNAPAPEAPKPGNASATEAPPPPEEDNAVTKNKYGIMAGSGMLLLGLMMGMDPLIGMLLALVAFAAGSFLGDKEKGMLGQMKPDLFEGKSKAEESKEQSKTIQKDGAATTEVKPTTDEKKTREAPDAPEAEKPTAPPAPLIDGRINLEELRALAKNIEGAELKTGINDVLRSMDQRLDSHQASGARTEPLFRNAVILTPESDGKNVGRIIYAERSDLDGSLKNIQIANAGRVIQQVVPSDTFKADDPNIGKKILKMVDEGKLSVTTVGLFESKADDVHTLLSEQLYTPKTPEADKGKGR